MKRRKTNVFEKLLLLVGLTIGIIGFYFLNVAFYQSGQVFDFTTLTATLIWLLLIFVMIQCAISENMREELGMIIKDQGQELKLLRQISNEHLEEIKLLRNDLGREGRAKK